jgi:hypothetical protein
VAAVRSLTAALAETRKALSPDQRSHAQGLLERSRMFVDVYTLKITPADARALVDGREPEYEPDGTLLLGFGSHNLEVSKPGFVLRSLVVNVRGNERKEVAVTLERKTSTPPKPSPSDLAAAPGPAVEKVAEPAHTHSTGLSTGWLIAASGTALLSLGAGAVWLFENNELSDCRNPPSGLRCDNKSSVTLVRNIAVGTTIGAGAAALGLALVGILTGDSDDRPAEKHSALSCSIVPAGVVCGRRF